MFTLDRSKSDLVTSSLTLLYILAYWDILIDFNIIIMRYYHRSGFYICSIETAYIESQLIKEVFDIESRRSMLDLPFVSINIP